jgi:hypothetical protein
MSTWFVIGSGPSLTDDQIGTVRQAREAGYVKGVVAISNVGLDKAPWADVLLSHDTAWWKQHPEALDFAGRKISSLEVRGCEKFRPTYLPYACNSGLMGMYYARDEEKAKQIVLLGFDMHGTHYFGKHPEPLKNATGSRFAVHLAQFARFSGPEVINCTPGSALRKFTMRPLEEVLGVG